MQEDEFIPHIVEPVPKLNGFKCISSGMVLYVLVTFSPFFAFVILWWYYNFWIAVAFFLFLTLIMGIVVSKMRIMSIPTSQLEMNYSNREVVRWYLAKNFC